MTRYKSNYSYAQDLQELRKHSMEISRKLANSENEIETLRYLKGILNEEVADLKSEIERLTDELNLAHETLRRSFSPQ
jgi:predicted  nucleic acid-binding Zn-ribbon protein